MNKNIAITALSFIILFISFHLPAQESAYYEPPQKTYREALNLFDQANYGASRQLFEKFQTEKPDKSNTFHENANYYIAVCAVQVNSPDAASLVQQFAAEYPESAWMPSINFELGKLYYEKNQYRQTLEAFQKVKPNQLNAEQKAEYYYKKGYCQMKINQYDGALASFGQVTKTKSDYAKPAYYYSAHIQYQKKDFEKALVGFKAIENDKKYGKYAQNYIIHIYYETGKYQQVIDEGLVYINSADSQTQNEIYRLVANSYYELGQYSQALVYFDLYEKSVRHVIEASEQYRIGYSKFVDKQYKQAINNFQKAIEGDKEVAQNAWYHLGFCYLNTDQQKFAQNAFLNSYKVGTDPQVTADALFNYVKITIELGGDPINDPVAIVNQYISKNPGQPRTNEAYDLLAQLYMTSKKYQEALLSIEAVNNPNSQLQTAYQQLAYFQGIEYLNRGEYAEAEKYFQKALTYTPNKILQAQTVFWIGDAQYNQKRYSEAERTYANFFNLSSAKQSGLYETANYNIAYAAFNQKKYSQSIDYFKRFINGSSSNQTMLNDAKLRLADSYFILKNYNQAEGWYQQVFQTGASGSDYALYQLAFCNGANGNFNQKISNLKTLVSTYKNSALYEDALYEIASTSMAINDQPQAIVYFDRLVKERPKSSLAKKSLVKMGFIYYDNNQNDMAITTMKKVITLYPGSLEAKEAITTLQSIYVDMGQVGQYMAYVKTLDFVQVSTSMEDSLMFVSGENYYLNNDCNNATPALKNYLKQFPNGGYVLPSYYYLSECYASQNNLNEAMVYYEKIIAFPDNQYTNKALLKASRIYFENEDYVKSGEYYGRLSQLAEDQGMLQEAYDGAMRSAFLNDNLALAEQFANEMLLSERITETQQVYAHYILAQAALDKNNFAVAEKEFAIVDEMNSSELGAEAKFEIAQIKFNGKKLDESETLIYQIPEQYPGQDFWIARGFILLSDIYVARDNDFQAEQTLQSVIENYPGDDLKQVANAKLQQLQAGREIKPASETEEFIDNN